MRRPRGGGYIQRLEVAPKVSSKGQGRQAQPRARNFVRTLGGITVYPRSQYLRRGSLVARIISASAGGARNISLSPRPLRFWLRPRERRRICLARLADIVSSHLSPALLPCAVSPWDSRHAQSVFAMQHYDAYNSDGRDGRHADGCIDVQCHAFGFLLNASVRSCTIGLPILVEKSPLEWCAGAF